MTLIVDDESTASPGPTRKGIRPRYVAALAVVGLLVASIGVYALVRRDPAPKGGAVSAAVMEDRYGVRIDLVALTALGGLVQLRFTVLDKDKADDLFHGNKPNLLVESNGAVLTPPTDTAHKMVLLNGAGYFLFYPNAADALHPGDKVSVVIDAVRLEHLEVKS